MYLSCHMPVWLNGPVFICELSVAGLNPVAVTYSICNLFSLSILDLLWKFSTTQTIYITVLVKYLIIQLIRESFKK